MKNHRRPPSTKSSENLFIRFCKTYPAYDRPHRLNHTEAATKKALLFFRRFVGARSA